MIKLIKLTKVLSETRGYNYLEQETEAQVATCPVSVNIDQIREFYPRKAGRVGTRITMINGAGLPVTETFEQVEAAISDLNN